MTTLTPTNAKAVIKTYGGQAVKSVGESVTTKGVAMGIYGPAGIGKTTLCASATDSEISPTGLHINCRGNPHVIASYGDRITTITAPQVDVMKGMEAIRKDVMDDPDRPHNIFLDTVSEMHALILRDLYGPTRDVTWEMHSASTADVMQIVRNWHDLTEAPYNLNIFFVFQETLEERLIRNQKVTRSELALSKSLQWQVPSILAFVGRLYIMEDTPPYRRMLDFKPIESQTQAKLQVDRNDPITSQIPFEVWDPSLASFIDTIKGRKPWPVEKHQKTKPK